MNGGFGRFRNEFASASSAKRWNSFADIDAITSSVVPNEIWSNTPLVSLMKDCDTSGIGFNKRPVLLKRLNSLEPAIAEFALTDVAHVFDFKA